MGSIHPRRITDWSDRFAPDLDVFEALASETLSGLPHEILVQCGHVHIVLAEYADDAVLDALGIDDPHELLGLFEGNALTQGATKVLAAQMPNRLWLYRRAILDYWASNTESLGDIVTHVVVHEIGHHFGLSDQEMDRIEAAAEA